VRIRCKSCHGAVWVELESAGAQAHRFACPTCSKEYRVDGGPNASRSEEHLATEARQLVRETQIDLPSAYSVLLGVMTLEEVLELGEASAAPSDLPAAAPPGGGSRSVAFDPEFRPAVEAGLLSPAQAMQRGIRSKYVHMLVVRHGLPDALALQVADNRISLLEALRRRGPEPGPPVEVSVPAPPPARTRGRWGTAGLVAGLLVIVAALLYRASAPSRGPAPSGSPRLSSVMGADVLSDESGRPVRISAAAPRTVLSAFCAADFGRRFEAVDLVPLGEGGDERSGDSRGDMLGLMRRVGRSGEMLSIVVREDRTSNRWVAGDGSSPLEPQPAPPGVAARIKRH